MNLSGNNLTYNYVFQNGTMNVMGNGNTINIKDSNLHINVMGNGNVFNIVHGSAQMNLNGNGNCIHLDEAELKIGINGNDNEVIENCHNECEDEQSSAVTIMSNNGVGNELPCNARCLSSNANCSNLNTNSYQNCNMQGQYGFVGYPNYNSYNQYPMGNQMINIPMIPVGPPPQSVFNPF